jgi:hypothetical protein
MAMTPEDVLYGPLPPRAMKFEVLRKNVYAETRRLSARWSMDIDRDDYVSPIEIADGVTTHHHLLPADPWQQLFDGLYTRGLAMQMVNLLIEFRTTFREEKERINQNTEL